MNKEKWVGCGWMIVGVVISSFVLVHFTGWQAPWYALGFVGISMVLTGLLYARNN